MTTSEIPGEQLFGKAHVDAYRETDGERGYLWRRGTTILLLTTKGASSGEERTTPLIFREDAGRYVIVASNGGSAGDPAWMRNIRANPDEVFVQVKGDRFPVVASVAGPDERPRLWDAMNEVWPDYREYQTKTDREIPVVLLTRR